MDSRRENIPSSRSCAAILASQGLVRTPISHTNPSALSFTSRVTLEQTVQYDEMNVA